MGSLIVDLDAKLSYHRGALEIKPFIGKRALERMHSQILQAEQQASTPERVTTILEEVEPETDPEPIFKASSENLDEIFVIDADLSITAKAHKLLTEQIIPVYWIRNGRLTAKFEPIPAHGSAIIRIAQETSPASMPRHVLRKFAKKQIQKLRKPLHLKTRQLDASLNRIRTIDHFLKLKNQLLTEEEIGKNDFGKESRSRPPDTQIRQLLRTVLGCIISQQISLSGLLPHGNGYFGTLLESILIETEISYIDLQLRKKKEWKRHIHLLLHQIEKTKLKRKVFHASVEYARLCRTQKAIRTPGLLK
ncbi:MAG: hypothetical protein D6732_23375 [Methanobacteriota archaeon]|nr:MAG: hypothetical protein D6732_23375 [Euryarchaeota archaeon]